MNLAIYRYTRESMHLSKTVFISKLILYLKRIALLNNINQPFISVMSQSDWIKIENEMIN